MLEEKDLQAIQAMMDEKLEGTRRDIMCDTQTMMDEKLEGTRQQIEQNLRRDIMRDTQTMMDEKLEETRQQIEQNLRRDIMHDTRVLMDTEFARKFDLLAEGQSLILEKLLTKEELDALEGRVDILERIVKRHSRELALKKAN